MGADLLRRKSFTVPITQAGGPVVALSDALLCFERTDVSRF